MNDRNWDELRLFLQVARSGSLAGAARLSGLSAPTIGRRMLALERSLGRSLFERKAQGYELAADGQTLFEHAKSMEKAFEAIDDWRAAIEDRPIVSVGSDPLTLHFLVERLGSLWLPTDKFRICLKVIETPLDMAHRGCNIAVIGHRIDNGNVAQRRSVQRQYFVYHADKIADARESWISIGTDVMTEPWMRWVFDHHEAGIATWVNAPRTLVDALEAGAGRSALPAFVGDRVKGLVRLGEPIAPLAHDSWIVSHDDDRHQPEIRLVLDRLALLLEDHRAVFAS